VVYTPAERGLLERARVGYLATADADARPHVVPVCFALVGDRVVSALDEKPQSVEDEALRRVRDLRANPPAALVVDHYEEDWDRLAWVQVRGRGQVIAPGEDEHDRAVAALHEEYDQYADHDLAARPVLALDPARAISWGALPE
jgi:PPOX class probable F420-dependent enzyme